MQRGRVMTRGAYNNNNNFENYPGPSNEDYQAERSFRGRGSRGNRSRGNQRGNRGNSGNNFNNWNTYKNTDNNEKVNDKQISGVPVPQHLSKKDSEFKNDPLYNESFFEEMGGELRRKPDDPKIHSEASGLKFIIENSYKTYVTKAAGFAKRMPESALAYYFSQLTLARLIDLHVENSHEADYETTEFVNQIKKSKYYVPKTLARYLSGFGNTKMPSGRTLKFEFPLAARRTIRAEQLSWPGRVSARTHYLYKSYPVSAVYALRVLQDIRPPPRRAAGAEEAEEEPENIYDWNLPEVIRPQNWANCTPNQNLMGWKTKEDLSTTQVRFLNEAGVFPDVFDCLNRKWNYNPGLMNAVSVELQNLQWIEAGEFPSSNSGSQGQITFSTYFGPDTAVEILGEFEGKSDAEIPGPIALLGVRHLYRIFHNIDVRNWSVFWDADDFDHVPDDWVLTVNDLRDGELPEMDFERYNTELFQPREFARMVIDRDNKRDVKKKEK